MFERELEEYLSTLRGRGGGELSKKAKSKIVRVIHNVALILQQRGLTRPDDEVYQAYKATVKGNEATQLEYVKIIKSFFTWLDVRTSDTKERNEFTVSELTVNEDKNEITSSEVENNTVIIAKTPVKAGRKRMIDENGENRTEKNTVYLTKSKDRAFKSLCSLYHLSFADYVSRLIDKELNSNAEALEQMRIAESLLKGGLQSDS